MHISKGLIIAIVGALLVGALEVVGENFVQNSVSRENTKPTSVTVPPGNLGDRLVYSSEQRVFPSERWLADEGAGFPNAGAALIGAYEVTGVGNKADRAGVQHDVVEVVQNTTASYSGGTLNVEYRESSSSAWTHFVDLTTRDRLGYRIDSQWDATSFFALQNQDQAGEVQYGPESADSKTFGRDDYVKFRLFTHHGRTYQVGDELPSQVAEVLVPEAAAIHQAWGAVDIVNIHATSRVARAAVVAGHVAVSIETKGCVRIEVTDPDAVWWWDGPKVSFLGLTVPVPSQVCFELAEWVSDEVPYPVLIEIHGTITGGSILESRTGLAAYEAGETPIPWGRDSAADHYLAAIPQVERSPTGQQYPGDGTGNQLGFPLESALRAIAGDPLLFQYAAWSVQHPFARLVGASLVATGYGDAGRLWSLTIADPAGNAFVVQSEQNATTGRSVQSEVGKFQIGSFPAVLPPTNLMTFGAAQAVWKTALSAPSNSLVPNAAWWGIVYRPGGVFCSSLNECGKADGGFYAGWSFDHVALAHRADPNDRGRTFTVVGQYRPSDVFFVVNAADGTIAHHREYHRDVAVSPLATAPNYQPPAPSVGSVPSPAPINFPHAAIASMSFLAFVLVAYMFPTLKFVATKALFLAPGFARIQKSDLLQNRVRETMITAIRADPGVTAPQLQELTKAGWSTVVYHLGVLERSKMVSSFIDGRHKRFFPVETVNSNDRSRLSLLKNSRTKGLYEAILGEPGVGFRALARNLGISRPALYWHVERLTKAGMVGQDREGNRIRFYANETDLHLGGHSNKSGADVT